MSHLHRTPLPLSLNPAPAVPLPAELTMQAIDPALISQLSRRKLRCASCDERRDNYNLRRLVLIQNSLVSANSCASLSSSSTSSSSSSASSSSSTSSSTTSLSSCSTGRSQVADEMQQLYRTEPQEEQYEEVDEEDYAFVFPTHWDDNTTRDEDEVNGMDESDWLEAVLSDLDEDVPPLDPESPPPSPPSTTSIHTHTSPPPINILHKTPGSQPQPRFVAVSEHLYFSPSQHSAYDSHDPYCTCDGLPYFDVDDYSDSDGDADESEPCTPLSTSLLSSRDQVRIADASEDVGPTMAMADEDEVRNPKNTTSYFPTFDHHHRQAAQYIAHDYFSCHYSRSYGEF